MCSRPKARPTSVFRLTAVPCSPAKAHTGVSNAESRLASMPGLHHIPVIQAVYYTKVILEPGTRIPKTKLFLCMEVEKRLLAQSESPSLL